jgi:ABC-2 type transport system permease protein
MMARLLSAELLKLRTTRTFAALVAAAVGLGLAIAVLIASLADAPTDDDLRGLLLTDTSSLFILVLGVVGAAGEWRHRTIAGTLLAAPERRALLAAKAISYAAAGAVLSLIVTIAIAIVTTAILGARGEPTIGVGAIPDVLWRNLLFAACCGALGVGVGALLRNQPTAIVLMLVILFVVEPALSGLAPDVGRFGPFLGAGGAFTSVEHDENLLSPAAGVLVLFAWVGVVCAAAAETLVRRDVT